MSDNFKEMPQYILNKVAEEKSVESSTLYRSVASKFKTDFLTAMLAVAVVITEKKVSIRWDRDEDGQAVFFVQPGTMTDAELEVFHKAIIERTNIIKAELGE